MSKDSRRAMTLIKALIGRKTNVLHALVTFINNGVLVVYSYRQREFVLNRLEVKWSDGESPTYSMHSTKTTVLIFTLIEAPIKFDKASDYPVYHRMNLRAKLHLQISAN